MSDSIVIHNVVGGGPQVAQYVIQPKSRGVYVVLGLFLGAAGIHNFYAGYIGRAIAQLLITLALGWLIIPLIAVWIWVIVELCVIKQDSRGIAFR